MREAALGDRAATIWLLVLVLVLVLAPLALGCWRSVRSRGDFLAMTLAAAAIFGI